MTRKIGVCLCSVVCSFLSRLTSDIKGSALKDYIFPLYVVVSFYGELCGSSTYSQPAHEQEQQLYSFVYIVQGEGRIVEHLQVSRHECNSLFLSLLCGSPT